MNIKTFKKWYSTLQGGDYVVTIMDHYGADFSVLILAFCEVVSVMWVYGEFSRRSLLAYIMSTLCEHYVISGPDF